MSSYGSRMHKVGSIFRRVSGLLKNGALTQHEKPLWYDVYKAFPPKVEPTFERPLPSNLEVQEILYTEDIGRVAFLQRYESASDDLHNLFDPNDKGTAISRFIDKGRSMGADDDPNLWSDDSFLSKVAEELQKDGIILRKKSPRVYFQDLVFLGTGSAYPSPHRGASALILRHGNGANWLFDCGEGTQVQLQRASGVRALRISRIFISHLHGDHVFGLPGLMATLSGMREHGIEPKELLNRRPEDYPGLPDLEIYGPRGLRRFLRSSIALTWSLMHMTYAVHELHPRDDQEADCIPYWHPTDLDPARDPRLPFEKPGRNIHPDTDGFFRDIFGERDVGVKDGKEDFVVHGFMLKHPVPCVGYLIIEPTPLPRLIAEKAVALGVKPGPLMGKLKNGQAVSFERDGKTVTVNPSDVLATRLRGRRVAILGDSCDSSELRRLLQCLFAGKIDGETTEEALPWRIDCLVHEATCHSVEQGDAATAAKGHSTARSAAAFAASIGARQLVLNHFSQRFLEEDFYDSRPRIPGQYSKVSVMLEDAESCEEFKGKVQLSADLKLIPIVPNVEDEAEAAKKKTK